MSIKQLSRIVLDTREAVGTQRFMGQSPRPQVAYGPTGENKMCISNHTRETVITDIKSI